MSYLKCTSEETSSVIQMIYWRSKLESLQMTFGASYFEVTVFDYYTTMLLSEVTHFQTSRAEIISIQLSCLLQG